ncbi:hypothetical protein PUN28_012596 [Cardiocondyla obscurior]|uniref:Uncharacterized protein n=1 Tax=Cardiocondyla obscurior TaxID=286306 RepID=A0AAW2FDG3_9HYME
MTYLFCIIFIKILLIYISLKYFIISRNYTVKKLKYSNLLYVPFFNISKKCTVTTSTHFGRHL